MPTRANTNFACQLPDACSLCVSRLFPPRQDDYGLRHRHADLVASFAVPITAQLVAGPFHIIGTCASQPHPCTHTPPKKMCARLFSHGITSHRLTISTWP